MSTTSDLYKAPDRARQSSDGAARRSRENFPVASRLIAAPLRRHVHVFYNFARAADDIADDPTRPADDKQKALKALDAILVGGGESGDPAPALEAARALKESLDQTGVPAAHARHLLQAFDKDARCNRYGSWSELLTYCQFSAAPVGRYLLDLHGEGRDAWPASDALCAALQILNHLQDCQADYRRLDRVYIPEKWLREAGCEAADLDRNDASDALRGVLNQVLSRVALLLAAARPLPGAIRSRRLRLEAAIIVALAEALARKLARHDPLTERVKLSRLEAAICVLRGAARGIRA